MHFAKSVPSNAPSKVCVHFGWVKSRAQILSIDHDTWSYVTSFRFLSLGLSMYFISNYGTLVTILTSVQQSGVHWLVVLGTSSEKVLIHSAQCTTLSYCLKVLNRSTSSTFSKYFPDSWMKVLSIFWGNAW